MNLDLKKMRLFDFKKLRSEWKQLTEVKKEEVVGLDVGSFSVKLVHLKSAIGGYVAAAACKVDIGITEHDDERAKSAKISATIRMCFDKAKIASRQAVCGVCGPEVAVRPFSFPSLPPDELNQAIMLEAEQVCPFDPAKNILEYQLLAASRQPPAASDEPRETSPDVSGVLVAATNEVVRGKTQLVSNASLNCAMMDIDGLALVNCFLQTDPNRSKGVTAILNVGHTFTNLVIVHEKKPPFVRDLLRGGEQIIERIAADKNATKQAITKLLADGGGSEIAESLGAASGKLVTEINETLRYYMSEQRLHTIDRIYVCGGFSLVKGFVELLNRQLPFGAALWNPFDHIGRPPAGGDAGSLEILETSGPAMAVAAGLAMRSI